MTKKNFLHALSLVREARIDEAVELVRAMEIGFQKRRLSHYKCQPDHREAATRLEAALAAATATESPAAHEIPELAGPLAPAFGAVAPSDSISLSKPEPFLAWTSSDWGLAPPLHLDALRFAEVWSLVGLASLSLDERERRAPLDSSGTSGAARFAHALGLSRLVGGADSGTHEPERTVRLTRVRSRREIEPTAERIARLLAPSEEEDNVRLSVKYVLVELLRNVVQHSGDSAGAITAAQRMDQSQQRQRPAIQLAVADAGVGIPRHIKQAHPHLVDYRQALERALFPHISGTFEEGLTGTFENAGLGLFMISELARRTGGQFLIASTGAALVVGASPDGEVGHPRFLDPRGIGFPGTLACFEIPLGLGERFHELMRDILRSAEARTPKRVASRWLVFAPAAAGALRVPVEGARENTLSAAAIAKDVISPALLARRQIELDFADLDLCTQSWLHALLFEQIRLAWALRIPIHVVHADVAVEEGLRFLEAYALGG